MPRSCWCVLLLVPVSAWAQGETSSSDGAVLQRILERLTALEEQNRQLTEELRGLRQQLQPAANGGPAASANAPDKTAALQEQVAVNETRVAEQAQTKVESSQKFPIRLNGMLLFNTFANSAGAPHDTAEMSGLLAGPERSGATVRQTLLGLEFDGPHVPGGGSSHGDVLMDFWAGGPEPGTSWLRLRHADLTLDWGRRSLSIGQEKPLISPYQPDSLAEVGIPPLSGAGNLWYWLPQIRYEERFRLSSDTGIKGQIALLQTDETYAAAPAPYRSSFDKARPGVEGRVAFWHQFDDTRRFEVGPGFHYSDSHVGGVSIASQAVSVDWSAVFSSHLQLTGTFFHGQNVTGLGGSANAFTLDDQGVLHAVRSSGGWTQISVPLTNRLTWNVFGGIQSDAGDYLAYGSTVHNLTYASNVMYHLGQNIVFSLEALQGRARNTEGVTHLRNHYDLALGYLF